LSLLLSLSLFSLLLLLSSSFVVVVVVIVFVVVVVVAVVVVIAQQRFCSHQYDNVGRVSDWVSESFTGHDACDVVRRYSSLSVHIGLHRC